MAELRSLAMNQLEGLLKRASGRAVHDLELGKNQLARSFVLASHCMLSESLDALRQADLSFDRAGNEQDSLVVGELLISSFSAVAETIESACGCHTHQALSE